MILKNLIFVMTFLLWPAGWGSKAGYYLSATCVLLGSVTLCLIDVHKKNMRRRRRLRKLRSRPSELTDTGCPEHQEAGDSRLERQESLSQEERPLQALSAANSLEDLEDEDILKNLPELSHFSEEGIADMDIPDDILDELEYLDNITSCDGVRIFHVTFNFTFNFSDNHQSIMLQ